MQENEYKFSKLIGELLKELRKSNTKKYVMFCDENGIADSTLQNIEAGLRSPKLYTVCRIIKALGLSFEEFGAILDKKIDKDIFEF
ncbi:MAG: helix-turn-helix domain-containing protein [Candidatus Gastranaerophilales bacterium]|nr:helix-turn-helix domain-containing protein [Candidatus Gastranaerophilales bacterium]MCM1074037.1 helix-turn-helix domain-containing protein [Bacteroides sp.]